MKEAIAKIPVFITVRSASTRLPEKCLLPFGEVSILEHVVRRAQHYDLDPIICTTLDQTDDVIVELAIKCNVNYFRGSTINKLLRWSNCCEYFNFSAFHSLDADDPFFCGEEIKRSFSLLKTGFDIVKPNPSSSSGGASVGYSMTADIVKLVTSNTNDDLDTEMIMPHFEKVPTINIGFLEDPIKHAISARMTIDYKEDYTFLEILRERLGNMASRKEIFEFIIKNPTLLNINNFRSKDWEKHQQQHILDNQEFLSDNIYSIEGFETIIVGGSNGIGQSLVKAFIKYKAKVTVFDINRPKFSGSFEFIKCDISTNTSIDSALKKYFKKRRTPRVLINCAAITISEESQTYTNDDWFKSLAVNLSGTFFLCREIGNKMIENKVQGSIINFTSIGALQGFSNNPAYVASKGGVRQLSKALAVEWGRYNIRVNNIAPGYTKTAMNDKSWHDPIQRKIRSDHTVLGRWSLPDELVGPTIFLASEASSYVTGTDLIVDGGWTAKGM